MFGKKNKKKQSFQLKLIGPKAPFSYTENFKSLRTNIEFLASASKLHTIMLTSAQPGDGKTLVSVNLAKALAENGKRVVLVDCDLRRGSIGRYFKISRRTSGITDIVCHMKQLEQALIHDTRQGFDLLVTGPLPLNPSELLSTGEMTELVQALSEKYDYVIIDTPPVMLVTDATILSRYVDGVMVVARVGQTSKQGLQQSISELEKVGANMLGVVLNDCLTKRKSYGDGYRYD